MKYKVARSLLVLSLALILVIGGTTVAWFTAEYKMPSAAELIMGTLSFEITNPEVYTIPKERLVEAGDTTDNWNAGDCKKFSWTFENTGTKSAIFRARPDYLFEPDSGECPCGGCHCGGCHWGNCGPGGGCGCGCGGCAGGDAVACDDCITWSLPAGSSDWREGVDAEGNPDGWFYYCQPVAGGDEITLELKGCLSDDAWNGSCDVRLEAEAVQATHGAVDAEWPDSPCVP